ncbi:MAG: protein kinase [Candidatus Eisenbacteria bacterium]
MAMNKDFGAFELKEKIGSGGMASVYLAVQKSLARPVVLKILYPHLAEDEKLVQRFEREARAAAMMRHENIIQVIDCGRYDDVAYIAMEFVEGMDLRKWIDAHGAPPIEMAMLMLRDLCRGLEHAHTHRIVHRDIKPANVMLTPDGTIKIMDFGLARSGAENSTQMTMVGSVMGTPAYMSPEQATGEVVDERSDIFSTGVVAYELLGGQRPFVGDSYSTVLRSILTIEPPDVTHFNPLVPEDVARIVRTMLQKDVSRRYATIAQVREELESIIEQMGLHRGKDLLREYALEPQTVSDRWRGKRLARHLDQGLYYENMGLSKIDDALLEFRRVLHLDPGNATAREHLKKLERDRDAVAASSTPAPPAAQVDPSAHTVMMTPGQGPSAPQEDRTMLISPGDAAAMTAAARKPEPVEMSTPAGAPPPALKSSAAKPPTVSPPPRASVPAPKPQPAKPAGPAATKSGLPKVALAGIGVTVVAIIAVAAMLMYQPKAETPPETSPRATQAVEPPVTTAPVVPAPSAPVTTLPATSKADGSLLEQARQAFAAGDWPGTTKLARQAMTAKGTSRRDQRAAQELVARSLVRAGKAADASLVYQSLLRSNPAFRPDPTGITKAETATFEQARAALASFAAKPAEPQPAPPATSAGPAMLTVTVSPFAESFIVDGETKDRNKQKLRVQLTAGKHTVRVTHPSLGSKEFIVDLDAGESKQLSHDFLSASAGSISVGSSGGWAEIYIDGDATGKTTSALLEGVLPGRHSISLVREGYTVEGGPQTVDVKAGQKASVQFKLKSKK